MPEPTPCRACRAKIIFVKTKNDRQMPLDAEPDPNGRIYLDDEGVAQVIPPNHDPANYADVRYTSHYATCPEAAKFRRKKKQP